MTRQEMADSLASVMVKGPLHGLRSMADRARDIKAIEAAAAELRKSCAGCKHFISVGTPEQIAMDMRFKWAWCISFRATIGAADGSGFCHEWSAK